MSKKLIAAIIATLLFAIVGIGTISAGYLDCERCSCRGYSSGENNTCSRCSHSFFDHRR